MIDSAGLGAVVDECTARASELVVEGDRRLRPCCSKSPLNKHGQRRGINHLGRCCARGLLGWEHDTDPDQLDDDPQAPASHGGRTQWLRRPDRVDVAAVRTDRSQRFPMSRLRPPWVSGFAWTIRRALACTRRIAPPDCSVPRGRPDNRECSVRSGWSPASAISCAGTKRAFPDLQAVHVNARRRTIAESRHDAARPAILLG